MRVYPQQPDKCMKCGNREAWSEPPAFESPVYEAGRSDIIPIIPDWLIFKCTRCGFNVRKAPLDRD